MEREVDKRHQAHPTGHNQTDEVDAPPYWPLPPRPTQVRPATLHRTFGLLALEAEMYTKKSPRIKFIILLTSRNERSVQCVIYYTNLVNS